MDVTVPYSIDEFPPYRVVSHWGPQLVHGFMGWTIFATLMIIALWAFSRLPSWQKAIPVLLTYPATMVVAPIAVNTLFLTNYPTHSPPPSKIKNGMKLDLSGAPYITYSPAKLTPAEVEAYSEVDGKKLNNRLRTALAKDEKLVVVSDGELNFSSEFEAWNANGQKVVCKLSKGRKISEDALGRPKAVSVAAACGA